MKNLPLPKYYISTRREISGSEGYVTYENNAFVINNVGNIFPIALYVIASIVTFVTISRFVEEERVKSGIFKALGYSNFHIIFKYVFYGFINSMFGTFIGIFAGHTFLPLIIYNSYSEKLILPSLEYYFYPQISIIAIFVGILSSVIPAYFVISGELRDSPSKLLIPKVAFSSGKIILEYVYPIWNKLSFKRKVTVRNIFRYKQRMFMTIFVVCSAISLLFAGLGLRSSIKSLNTKQFSEIIKYDMIISKKENIKKSENEIITKILNSKDVEKYIDIRYERTGTVAGRKNDEQEITSLIISKDNLKSFKDYIFLKNRYKNVDIEIDSKGVVISEKLAQLMNLSVGDDFLVKTSEEREIKLKISNITEMYMNHFIFMSDEIYEKSFGKNFMNNANLVCLKDKSVENIQKISSKILELDGISGVLQNTYLKIQIEGTVDALDKLMGVMIGVSALLAVIVLYNLTNINVSERIRELSTVKFLGFFNREVTMREVTMYIYRETIYLSIFGIFAGFVLGHFLHSYMVSIIPPDSVMFDPKVDFETYFIPTLVVITVLTILGFVVNYWMKKVNILESLKSMD